MGPWDHGTMTMTTAVAVMMMPSNVMQVMAMKSHHDYADHADCNDPHHDYDDHADHDDGADML